MSLFFEIENLKYLESEKIIFEKCNQIKTQMTPYGLKKHIDYYLLHLRSNHELPGKVFETLSGIGDWISEKNFYTDRQFLYSVLTMAEYFDQFEYYET